MSDLKATEFKDILEGDFDTPCYVEKEESFKHALAVGRPIIVLYGEEAVSGMKEFIEIGKNKKWFNISDKLSEVMRKLGFAMTVILLGTGAPIMLIKEGLGVVAYGFLMKIICDNKEFFKEYNMLVDEKNDRVIFLKKSVKNEDYSFIMSQICDDFSNATTELIDNYSNILKVDDVFVITGKGAVLCGKVLKGMFSVDDEVKIMDGKLTEYASEKIVGIEQFRKIVNKVSTGEDCGILFNRKDDLRNEIEKQRLLLKDIYIVK